MNKKAILFVFALLAIPLVLAGCSSKAPASPTTNPALIYTAAAQTADARLTEIFRSTPSATPSTPTATFVIAETMAAQTAAAIATQSANLTPIPQGTVTPTSAPTGPAGDLAIFVSDVTIKDGTVISPGASFTKTWKLQNGGTTTWSTSYSLVFFSGEQMGTVTSVPLSQSVPPGAQIDVSVDLVAPDDTGTYQGYWKMKNASGQIFDYSVYVLINVGSGGATQIPPTSSPGSTPTSTGVPTSPIDSLTMSVDNPSYSGPCDPSHTFTFIATITLNRATNLTYNLEAGTSTPGFEFDLPGPQTSAFEAGTYPLPFALDFTSSGDGWVRFHVTSPVDEKSNDVSFSLTCTP